MLLFFFFLFFSLSPSTFSLTRLGITRRLLFMDQPRRGAWNWSLVALYGQDTVFVCITPMLGLYDNLSRGWQDGIACSSGVCICCVVPEVSIPREGLWPGSFFPTVCPHSPLKYSLEEKSICSHLRTFFFSPSLCCY